ncbi:ComEC/Rec2 family competence protein [Duganella sp. HH105]|uniref:ComEC/Rec2 family competence protein n=1 Tax=Duganella sp. HH105 TaxID=1781067 RepID=UPI000877C6C2|nr:MBL fold metallo-hydrolase [Duganella sp. HH105]OEZ62095.1 metallo-beta-lactamase superfamily protein [Duganella sp. HH105]
MVELFMLPAQYGDCLWLEYGPLHQKKRILIDCGLPSTWKVLKKKFENLPDTKRHFELLVITHIDSDHIGGAISLLRNRKKLKITFGEIWFNAQEHLPDDTLGKPHADKLTELLSEDDLKPIWNTKFGGAVVVPEVGKLPFHEFDGFDVTLLSPTPTELRNLAKVWPQEIAQAVTADANPTDALNIEEPEDYYDDRLGEIRVDIEALLEAPAPTLDDKAPNGSSIAFILEVEGARILFAADAFAPVLLNSIKRLYPGPAELCKLSAFKLAHHGSRRNLTEDLLDKLECKQFLISSNGVRFKHPDAQTIALLVKNKTEKTLYFNYQSDFTSIWGEDEDDLQDAYNFRSVYINPHYKITIEALCA